jgi:hypothetical protein
MRTAKKTVTVGEALGRDRVTHIQYKAYPSGSGGTKCSDGCGLTA